MPEHRLSSTKVLLYSEEDRHLVESYAWRPRRVGKTYHARALLGGGGSVMFHTLVMNTPPGMVVAHLNEKGLDNRRENLRLVTPAQLFEERRRRKGRPSKYLGVYPYDGEVKRWQAKVRVEGERLPRVLGYYHTQEAAARAYDEAVRCLVGPHARTNFR